MKKLFTSLLCVAMIMAFIPTMAFAEDAAGESLPALDQQTSADAQPGLSADAAEKSDAVETPDTTGNPGTAEKSDAAGDADAAEADSADNAETILSGTVETLTDGAAVDDNTVTFGAETTLAYSAEGNEAGRTPDCWWAGIKMTAPAGAADNAQYQKIARWWEDTDGTSTAWGEATPWRDNGDGTFWVPVKPEYFKSYGNILNYRYQFDWNGDGTYEQQITIKVTNNVNFEGVNHDAAARIGSQGYTKLQNAINKAADNDTIHVLKDTAGATLALEKSVTLDIPASVTIGNVSGKAYALGLSKGTLTITGNGTVEGTSIGVNAQGTAVLNINGSTIKGNYAVYTKGTTAYINGGKLKGVASGVYATTGSTMKINGGNISGSRGVIALNGANIDITGETVQITGTASSGIHGQAANTNIHISAGTINGAKNGGIYLSNGPSAVIEGTAQITGKDTGAAVFGGPEKTTLTGDARTKLTVAGDSVITGTAGYGIAGNGSADGTVININGGKINGGITAIYHPQVGDMTITGGEITGQNGVQFSGAGKLEITGGDITATLDYTEAPEKPSTQTDGTIADGAAVSIVSRGGGWQSSDNETMHVTLSGGTFTSQNNSAIAVYRIKQLADKTWVVGDETGLPSYLENLSITGGTFTGNTDKGILYIDTPAMDALSITGGYYNQDIDAGTINYVDDTYAAHPVNEPAGYYHVHHPDFYGENDYGIDETNHWQGCRGDNGNCIEGKTVEAHNWNDGIITRYPTYTAEGERTFTCETCGYQKTESIPRLIYIPGTDDPDNPSIDDPDVPLGPDPGLPEDPDNPDNPDDPDTPVIDEPDVPLGPAPELPDEDGTVIEDPDTPLSGSPQTGDNAQTWWILILIASTGMLGLTLADKRRKN